MTVIGTLASIGMAVGPPLVYADQAYSILKKKDSRGFSHDVCGVVVIANIIRVFFWLGNRFETPLLVQSILLIITQLLLLSLCLHYAPMDLHPATYENVPGPSMDRSEGVQAAFMTRYKALKALKNLGGGGPRPFNFWQWEGYGTYLEFLAGMIVVLGFLQIVSGRWSWYIDSLGFIALTIESTLPIPQFISNYRRKSTYGFRASTLAGWLFGDTYKTIYFFVRKSPIQFQITAIMTVCWDIGVAIQRYMYGNEPPRGLVGADEDREQGQGLRYGQ